MRSGSHRLAGFLEQVRADKHETTQLSHVGGVGSREGVRLGRGGKSAARGKKSVEPLGPELLAGTQSAENT
jgi:hypothetical protein